LFCKYAPQLQTVKVIWKLDEPNLVKWMWVDPYATAVGCIRANTEED